MSLRVLDIVAGTSVDGPGLRTSIYFAGCSHHCHGCHNPQSWDFHGGKDMTVDEIVDIVERNGFNVTFSGGDPLYQAENLLELAKELKGRGYTLWCYTGFLYEDIVGDEKIAPILQQLDVLVDGPFIESLRDIGLIFRGSSNQRLIDLRKSDPEHIILWEEKF